MTEILPCSNCNSKDNVAVYTTRLFKMKIWCVSCNCEGDGKTVLALSKSKAISKWNSLWNKKNHRGWKMEQKSVTEHRDGEFMERNSKKYIYDGEEKLWYPLETARAKEILRRTIFADETVPPIEEGKKMMVFADVPVPEKETKEESPEPEETQAPAEDVPVEVPVEVQTETGAPEEEPAEIHAEEQCQNIAVQEELEIPKEMIPDTVWTDTPMQNEDVVVVEERLSDETKDRLDALEKKLDAIINHLGMR